MEYLYYLLFIGSILSLLFLILVHSVGLHEENNRVPPRDRTHKSAKTKPDVSDSGFESLANQLVSGSQQLSRVPTPWGWPGHNGHGDHGAGSWTDRSSESHGQPVAGDALHKWLDRLVAEKRTVEDQEYILKKNESLRALLEDRYGKSDRTHDQLDNNNKTSAEHVSYNLRKEARQLTPLGGRGEHRRTSRLGEIRMPWGW